MRISKKPNRVDECRRRARLFRRARDACQFYLENCARKKAPLVMLPSYVGWSPREGSGVIDPVLAAGGEPTFYRVDEQLNIDITDVEQVVACRRPDVLVAIHYFGRPDPNLSAVAAICRDKGILLVEDEAHAMLTDLVGGICGRFGDAALFSLHKMLPVDDGGVLVLNSEPEESLLGALRNAAIRTDDMLGTWDYDLGAIAERRWKNQAILTAEVVRLAGLAHPLWKDLDQRVVLQTFPLVLEHGNRDAIYERMNELGLGVVSLYHTLVREIPLDTFPENHSLSRRILNLPLHQDVDPEQLPGLVEELARLLEKA